MKICDKSRYQRSECKRARLMTSHVNIYFCRCPLQNSPLENVATMLHFLSVRIKIIFLYRDLSLINAWCYLADVNINSLWLRHRKLGRAKRIWYLSPMRAAKVQASLRIRAVSPEPPLLAHTSSESRGTFRQKTRSLAPLNGWACAVKMCHDGMLEDTNSLVAAQLILRNLPSNTLS